MSDKRDEADWWKKPDHLDPQKSNKPKPSGKKRRATKKGTKGEKKSEITQLGFVRRIIMHILIILILGLILAIITHFILRTATRHGAKCEVPEFEMLLFNEADSLASIYDLHLILNDSLYAPSYPRGVVIEQIPEAGTIVKPGRAIYITINATQRQMVTIPYVAGRSLRQGKSMLETAGLTIEELIYEEDLATNYILSQSYNSREITKGREERVPVGSGVTLHVGLGNGGGQTLTPQLVGRSIHSAKSAIWDAGLNVGEITKESDINPSNEHYALVMTQSSEPDSLLRLGSKVSLSLTLYPEKIDSLNRARERDRLLLEMLRAEEQMLTDSLTTTLFPEEALNNVEQKPTPKPKAERVDFEDLF